MRTVSKLALAGMLLGVSLLVWSCDRGPGIAATSNSRLTEDEKHRLYAAALAASESPLDSETFNRVCRRLEIVDAWGKPNEKHRPFVSAHVDWATRPQMEQFRNEINTREKARQYIDRHLAVSPIKGE